MALIVEKYIDFVSQEQPLHRNPRHKVVTPDELDRLANNNSAENTRYQTKWATTVMKGTFSTKYSLIREILTKQANLGDFYYGKAHPKITFSVTLRPGLSRSSIFTKLVSK